MTKLGTPQTVDFVVIGAGAAGLSAALFAAIEGHSVIVLEKSSLIGGTSAYTAGTLWVPATDGAKKLGIDDSDATTAERYVSEVSELDENTHVRLRNYLTLGPEAIRHLEDHSEVEFEVRERHPDYFSDVEGSSMGYRALEAITYKNVSSKLLKKLRPQQQELTVFGGMALNRHDIEKLSHIARSPFSVKAIRNYFHAGMMLAGHVFSKIFLRRPARFTMGNALVARLIVSLEKRSVPILTNIEITNISKDGEQVKSVQYFDESGVIQTIHANRAIIIASGGFNRNPHFRQQVLGQRPEEWSAISPNNSGGLYDQLVGLGAVFENDSEKGAFWAPISLPPRKNGGHGSYPHFIMDRGKPGFIVVDQNGKRYQNEALSYNHFSQQMLRHGETAQPSFLIADSRAVKQYGIGVVRPGGWGKRGRMKDGYLARGKTIAQLAERLNISAEALQETITRFNRFVDRGVDEDFRRGETAYEKNLGDQSLKNPNLGKISTGPFYAIRLYPGEIGASAGFQTDEWGAALDMSGKKIPGLYIIGNDMSSIFGKNYPGPGITLGPAVVFGYAAIQDSSKKR